MYYLQLYLPWVSEHGASGLYGFDDLLWGVAGQREPGRVAVKLHRASKSLLRGLVKTKLLNKGKKMVKKDYSTALQFVEFYNLKLHWVWTNWLFERCSDLPLSCCRLRREWWSCDDPSAMSLSVERTFWFWKILGDVCVLKQYNMNKSLRKKKPSKD